VKRAARGLLKILDAKMAKNLPSGQHRTRLFGYIYLFYFKTNDKGRLAPLTGHEHNTIKHFKITP